MLCYVSIAPLPRLSYGEGPKGKDWSQVTVLHSYGRLLDFDAIVTPRRTITADDVAGNTT